MKYVEMNGAMSFLVLEDDPNLNKSLLDSLKKMGYKNFQTAATVFDALQILRGNAIDFVFAKYKLSDETGGAELLVEIQNNLKIERPPFLVYAPKWTPEDIAYAVERGADGYISAPFGAKELAQKLTATWARFQDPNNLDIFFEKGRKLYLAMKFDLAEKVFLKLEEFPKICPRARIARAKIALRRGKPIDALDICMGVQKDFPTFVPGLETMGEVYLTLKEPNQALQTFIKAITISPKNPYRYQMTCEILQSMNDWVTAKLIYEKAVSMGIQQTFVKEGLAQSCLHLNEKENALKIYEELSQKSPKNASYLNSIGLCHRGMNNHKKALVNFEKAQLLERKNTKILFNVALTYSSMNQVPQAISTLKDILQIEPKHEKAILKILELQNPEAYKLEIAKRLKANPNAKDFLLEEAA